MTNESPQSSSPLPSPLGSSERKCLRVLIVDDEINQRVALRYTVTNECDGLAEVIGEAHSVLSAIEAIKQHEPDVVLLDIELMDGRGFAVLDAFDDPPFMVIFITSYREFGADAYEYQAIDYVLKPVEPERLTEALRRAMTVSDYESMATMLTARAASGSNTDRILLAIGERFKIITCADVLYVSSHRETFDIYFTTGKVETIARRMSQFEHQFAQNGFVRINRSMLVNMRHVQEIIPKRRSWVVCLDDASTTQLEVTESYRVPLIEYFQR